MERSIGIHYQPVKKVKVKSNQPGCDYNISLEEGILDGGIARFRIVNIERWQAPAEKGGMEKTTDVVLPADKATLDAIITALTEMRDTLDAPLPKKEGKGGQNQ